MFDINLFDTIKNNVFNLPGILCCVTKLYGMKQVKLSVF